MISVGGRFIARVDLGWPAERVVVEIDGYLHHSDRAAFQRDRSRQNELVLAGWTVLRFTVDDLTSRPDHMVAEVRAALAGRRP